MQRSRSAALLLSLVVAIAVAPDSPDGLFCTCGIQARGTVAMSDSGTIVITFEGVPRPGKFDRTSITTRIWGRTRFGNHLSRNAPPGPGLPVVVTLDVKRNGDGSYRLNEIWANVR